MSTASTLLETSELGLLRFAREHGYLRPTEADLTPTELFCSIIVQNAGARYVGRQDAGYGKPWLVLFNDPLLGSTLALPGRSCPPVRSRRESPRPTRSSAPPKRAEGLAEVRSARRRGGHGGG